MPRKLVFVNRRRGVDRRFELDPCKDMPMDLCHRKRRKSRDRRDESRSLTDDYYAYMQKVMEVTHPQVRITETEDSGQ